MPIYVRLHTRLTAIAVLALVQLVVVACDKMPLTAPTGSTVTVRAGTEVLPAGGSTEISAFVAEDGGNPVQNGTVVRFAATLGRVDPAEAQTRNGLAVTTFLAGDVSGRAEVRATSGSIAAPATTAAPAAGAVSTASGNTVVITIGAAAIQSVLLRASPQFVPFGGGTVQLVATVIGPDSRVMGNIPVTFSSTQGTLGAAQVVTDANGEARTSLTTDRDAEVRATAGTRTSDPVTIVRRAAPVVPTITLGATKETPVDGVGQRVVFTATVDNLTDTGPVVRYRWNFGDDTSVETSSAATSHIYTQPLARRTVTVEAQLSNGQTVSAVTEIIIDDFQ